MTCKVAPKGWWCSRDSGHDGPCAARPKPLTTADLYRMGARIKIPARKEEGNLTSCIDCKHGGPASEADCIEGQKGRK